METIAERFDVATATRTRFDPGTVTLQDKGRWPGLRLEQWETPLNGDLPETVLFQHGLVINLDPLTDFELRWPGQRPVTGSFAAGSVLLLPAGQPYSSHSIGEAWRGLVVALVPELLQSVVGASAARALELVPSMKPSDGFLEQASRALASEVRDDYPTGALYGESLTVAIAAHLVRHYSADPRLTPEHPRADDERRRRIRDFVLERLAEPMTLAEMAAFLQLDVYSFARWFKTAFGVPPHRYVLLARIERAKELLTSTAEPLAELALQCGFSSQSHLTTTFRRFVGVSPRGYRLAI